MLETHDNSVLGTHIRSMCQWHEGEKSTNFLLNLTKFHGAQSQIHNENANVNKHDKLATILN